MKRLNLDRRRLAGMRRRLPAGALAVQIASMRLSIGALVGLVLLAALGACVSAPRAANVSICEIVSDHAAYDGRTVRVTGMFASDYHHGAVLLDGSCHRLGIAPVGPAERTRGQSAFERTLCSTHGLVRVTATGRLEVRADRVPRLVLHVSDYDNPQPAAYDPAWAGSSLEYEAQATPEGVRALFCRMAQLADERMAEQP